MGVTEESSKVPRYGLIQQPSVMTRQFTVRQLTLLLFVGPNNVAKALRSITSNKRFTNRAIVGRW